jgi:hypothetical protein
MLLTLALCAGLAGAPEDPVPPDPKAVAAAVKELKQAFAGDVLEPKLSAVRAGAEVLHADVIAALAKGLKEERPVQEATLEALRFMPHPAALEALHGAYKQQPELTESKELLPFLLRSIGQHASEASIDILADEPFKASTPKSFEARILGLGRIRERRSVEELMALMQLGGRGPAVGHMQDFRLALMVLSGVDQGTAPAAWVAWWNDSKKTFEVKAEPPRLPEALQKRWDVYWGLAHEKGRAREREDRGNDGKQG